MESMFWSTGLLLVLALSKVPAELVKPELTENVINAASETGERIVTGWEAYPGQIPYYAFLRLINPTGGVLSCGGSVISRDWVITAAHCTSRRVSAVVLAGLTRFEAPLPQYVYETREFFIHPTYNVNLPETTVQLNDISVIKLQERLTYSSLLQPIRLQTRADAFRNYNNEVVIASGFGRTWTNGATSEWLRWVYLRAISNPTCLLSYGTAYINDNTICTTYYNETSQNICMGDTGGPLVHENSDGVPTLIGIASFVTTAESPGCFTGLPSGFIRPGPFHSWLEQVTGIDFDNLDESATVQPTPIPATTPLTTPTPPVTTELPETTQTTPEPEGESEEDSSTEEEKDTKVIVQVKVKVKVTVNNINKKDIEVE